MEKRLQFSGFFRCHRSYLVNIRFVKEIVKWSKNSYELVLKVQKNKKIPLSKYRVFSLEEKIGW